MMTIAVCVCTKGRPDLLQNCLLSIFKNTLPPDEVIVINEGKKLKTNPILRRFASKIMIVDYPASNLSLGRNKAVTLTKSDIICFTDDDCIADRNWLKKCLDTFKQNSSCAGVFGSIKPYQPKKHHREACPCTFTLGQKTLITEPCYHGTCIGFGNNMAFKREIFTKMGNFKTWLGAGSIGLSAEDGEFALRVLLKKYRLVNNPEMAVFHNRWLSDKRMKRQELFYTCGEMACYGYLMFQGHSFAKKVTLNNLTDSFHKLFSLLRRASRLKWDRDLFADTGYALTEACYRIRGLSLGLFFSIVDPLQD